MGGNPNGGDPYPHHPCYRKSKQGSQVLCEFTEVACGYHGVYETPPPRLALGVSLLHSQGLSTL